MSDSKYIIGIDLGTTHCVLAYTPAQASGDEEPSYQVFPVPQVVNPGEVEPRRFCLLFFFYRGLTMFLRSDWRCPGISRRTWPWVNSPAGGAPNFPTGSSHRPNPGCATPE